jgi:hypothetical protein
MFTNLVNKILKEYNVSLPLGKVALTQGPNIDFRGPSPSGFLGGGLPGINPSHELKYKILKNKKKKRKLSKRVSR